MSDGRARGRARGRALVDSLQRAGVLLGQPMAIREPPQLPPDAGQREGGDDGDAGAVRGQGGYRVTKPENVENVIGHGGAPLALFANYFRLNTPKTTTIMDYHVAFTPNVESVRVRKSMLYEHMNKICPAFIFDGVANMKALERIPFDKREFTATRKSDGANVNIILTEGNEIAWGSFEMMRMYNTQMRRNLGHLGFLLMGRYFYDRGTEKRIPEHGIAIWRGLSTAINEHAGGILMSVDTVFKFVRSQKALDVLRDLARQGGDWHNQARKELAGSIVMTDYNNKTYRIDDITFEKNPTLTFEKRGEKISIADYLKQQYEYVVRDLKQPLLEVLPNKRDQRAGQTNKMYLVPECCSMTGLTDRMREDFNLGRQIANISRLNPQDRCGNLRTFITDLKANVNVCTDMGKWGLEFEDSLVKINGRQLVPEPIIMGGNISVNYSQNTGDFSKEIRGKAMFNTARFTKWVVIVAPKERPLVQDFLATMYRVSEPMRIGLAPPKTIEIANDRTGSFVESIKGLPAQAEMIVCIVPNNNKDRYDSIKKICCCERGIASQVIVARTLSKKAMLMSVCTKVAIQMACKIGAEPWALKIPFNNTMVIGYDTYHDGTLQGKSAGGFVCSLNPSLSRWFSRVAYHTSREDMSNNFAINLTEGLKAYFKIVGQSPTRIIVYRDGVSDGMIPHVHEFELNQIKNTLNKACSDNIPKLSFVIVTKRINARFFTRTQAGFENPPPGTIVDTVVTRPERYDFYLISQSVRQGTVAPTMYNIIEDDGKWSPNHHQTLAYKLTHLYYNWMGTIRVPAPCQYAHKLAFLTGTSLHREPSTELSNTLFYL